MNNNPKEYWMNDEVILKTDEDGKFELFYIKYYKPRITRGLNPDVASNDSPEGFTEWLKSHRRGVK